MTLTAFVMKTRALVLVLWTIVVCATVEIFTLEGILWAPTTTQTSPSTILTRRFRVLVRSAWTKQLRHHRP